MKTATYTAIIKHGKLMWKIEVSDVILYQRMKDIPAFVFFGDAMYATSCKLNLLGRFLSIFIHTIN